MKLRILFLLLLIYCASSAQTEVPPPDQQPVKKEKVPFKERLFINPDLGLQFGTVTVVDLSPRVGYKVTEKFGAGVGATYIYIKDNTYKNYGYIYESSIYGGSIFTQYQLIEQFKLYSEYEVLSLESFDSQSFETTRRSVPFLFAGGGYTSRIGGNSYLSFMVLFDLIESPYSIYDNPVIRVGFNFGL